MSTSGIVRHWSFTRSRSSWRERLSTACLGLRRLRRAPPHAVIRALFPAPRWTLYFMFTPGGALSELHRFTLARLRALDRRLLVICAAPTAADVPRELLPLCDAIYWKGLSGYDFSAYAIGLRAIARHSPDADVLVLNDSVYGPFASIDALLADADWDLTGFTGSAEQRHHIQSYAFHIRRVRPSLMRQLRSVLPRGFAFDDVAAVIRVQELRFAGVAARHMSVGALWFDPTGTNPTLRAPLTLLDEGFPFVKRSLMNRYRHMSDLAAVLRRLAALGHAGHAADRTG